MSAAEGFDRVLACLQRHEAKKIAKLRDGSAVSAEFKIELARAMDRLRRCAAHGISARSVLTRLPSAQTTTPSSEFRLVEDHESDDRRLWTEVKVDGQPLRPLPGSLIVEPNR